MCDFYHSISHEFRGPEDPSKNTIVQLEGKKKKKSWDCLVIQSKIQKRCTVPSAGQEGQWGEKFDFFFFPQEETSISEWVYFLLKVKNTMENDKRSLKDEINSKKNYDYKKSIKTDPIFVNLKIVQS